MNQRYGYLRCMEALAIMNKNGCFSCSEHGYFFLLRGKKSVVSVVVTVRCLSCFEACPKNDSHSSYVY